MKKQTAKGMLEIIKGTRRGTYSATLNNVIVVNNCAIIGAAVAGRPELIAVIGGKVALTQGEVDHLTGLWADKKHQQEMDELNKGYDKIVAVMAE